MGPSKAITNNNTDLAEVLCAIKNLISYIPPFII